MANSLNVSSKKLVVNLINQDNGTEFLIGDLDFTTPTDASTGKNTDLVITAAAGSEYTGSVTINYDRLSLTSLFASITSPAVEVDAGKTVSSVADILTAIRTKYSILLQASDIEDTAIESLPATVTVTASEACPAYTGSVDFAVTQAAA